MLSDEEDFVTAFLSVSPGTLDAPAVFHANTLSELPAPTPGGTVLASGVFEFARLAGGSIINPVTIGIGFDAEPSDADVRWYDPVVGFWVAPLGTVSIDMPTKTAFVKTQEMGTYAVFAPTVVIPALSQWGLVILTLLGMTVGMILIGRHRAKSPMP